MNTLLLRSAQENETKDKYQEAFREADVDCVSVSPIDFEFINLETLYAHISHPEDHSGLIFSSPRTVQSVALCLKKHDENDEWDARLRDEWNKLPAFSVGTSTGGEVRKLGLHPVGEDSGNAENLCRIILEAVKSGSKPLLYPCGTMRREVIPKTLRKEGIPFREDVVYQTISNPDLEKELSKYLQAKGSPFCIVFFSPSGVQFSKDVLHKSKADLQNTKFLAIGRTTQTAMEEHGYMVAGVAEKPNPTALLQTIKQCHDGSGS
ncbi:uroporphyrinogen-III synthase-like [Lytechinus variegatus]|uniref:uroporphyrinogen-III synthase-like n=1 Tax=Lytechinus variegatus TaxID=7654 RepID=UPI001BB1CD6D|nr:uroporphyrinogen-III synthase-like [Lytechinus variegatus]